VRLFSEVTSDRRRAMASSCIRGVVESPCLEVFKKLVAVALWDMV